MSTTECSCRLWPSPGMYVPTSTPFVSRTRAILRSAEFGLRGVVVETRVQTPRFWGAPASAGVLIFAFFLARPLRTSWLTVGMLRLGLLFQVVCTQKDGGARGSRRTGRAWYRNGPATATPGRARTRSNRCLRAAEAGLRGTSGGRETGSGAGVTRPRRRPLSLGLEGPV